MIETKKLRRQFPSIVTILLALQFSVHAQTATERIFFDQFGVEEGLPEEYVRDMVQDQEGFIWATTQNGLVRYDGYTLTIFRSDRSKPDQLWPVNLYGGLILSRNGHLWLGGTLEGGGVSFFNPETAKFTNYEVDKNDSTKIPFESCYMLFEDLYGHIWFSSFSYGDETVYCRLDPATGKVHRYFHNILGTRQNTIVMDLQIAESKQDSSIWAIVKGDLLKYDRSHDRFNVVHKNKSILPGTTGYDSLMELTPPRSSGLIPVRGQNQFHLWDPVKQVIVSSYDYVHSKNKGQPGDFSSEEEAVLRGCAFEDEVGHFWISSGANLTRIDHQSKLAEHFEVGKRAVATDQDVRAGAVVGIWPVYQDSSNLWFRYIGSQTGFFRYEYSTKRFRQFNSKFNTETNTPVTFVLTHFLRDRTGLFWIGTRPNFYKQNAKKQQFTNYHHQAGNSKSLPSDTVYCLLKDSENRLWAGTHNGLAVLQNETGEFTVYRHNPKQLNSLSHNVIRQLFEDSDKNIWVATDNGINKWNRATGRFQRMLVFDQGNRGIAIAEDTEGRIWASVLNKGVYVFDKTGKLIKSYFQDAQRIGIAAIYHDSRGNTWLGDYTGDKGVYRFTDFNKDLVQYKRIEGDETSPANLEIRFFIEDRQKNLWIGCDGPLLKFNYEADNFTRYFHPAKANSFQGYAFDKLGNIWFRTYSSGGLVSVNPETGDITAYGEEHGLLHNDIRGQITTDIFGKIWLPSQRGLSAFDPITKTFTNYTERDGYKTGRFWPSAVSINNEIWFGTITGLYKIKPENLLKRDTTPPQVHITSMSIMDSVYTQPDGTIFKKSVMFTSNIELKHWQKDLGFDFVALHYLRPEDNQYSYMLENYDKNWSAPSKARRATYTNLSPGTYTFKVKGSNADGIWNETGPSITIVILPPWWQTWWAYGIYLIGLSLIGYRVHVYQKEKTMRIERERVRDRELAQAKEIEKAYNELKATQSQLIQSEKMASLGELTAGIAHEIQNPLNFVNNFSEVNKELLQEMEEELKAGRNEEAKTIAKSVIENEEKILFHGKRADSIVKGMLQHSRASSGVKEPTDINALADEYLRLAYHGLRAKDKSFNAAMKTDLDTSLGKVNVVPQDLGRVILNLITNGFYAVTERKKTELNGYEPTVTVITKKDGDKVKITVKDNGNGIPQNILDKIFQPFFTTKPSGQGTGLGLSMSYDIVTKVHGGKIDVDTKPGQGTSFIITIPIQPS